MKRSIIGAAVATSLFLAPLAHAQTTSVPINDPITDTIQLWTQIASSLEYLAQQSAYLAVAALSSGGHPATPVGQTQPPRGQQTASLAETVASFEAPSATSTEGATTTATFDQTTLSQNVKSAASIQSASNQQPAATVLTTPTPAFNASNFVTQNQLTAQLNALSNALTAKFGEAAPETLPQYVAADGNGADPFAAASAIDNLSNVTISNSTIDAASLPNLSGSYLSLNGGTVSGALFDTSATSSYFLGALGVGTSSPAVPLEIQDTGATSTAIVGSNVVTDGTFTSNPSGAWALGANWSWDSINDRAEYSGTGGPISSLSIANGGTGYSNGDTITISGGTSDATYTATVNSSGAVTGLTQVSAGTAYSASGSTAIATTGGTGSGLTVTILQIANGSGLTQTLSPASPAANYYSVSYDSWISGTTYQVSFTISNYSGNGQLQVGIGTVSNQTQLPYYYKQNGTFTITLTSASPTITFTPTADFAGEVTNVAVEPITPAPATLRVTDTNGDSRFEIRSGGVEYNTFLGVDAGRNTNDNVQGYDTAVGYDALFSNINSWNNIAVGDAALYANTTGNDNSAVGESALQTNTTGAYNTALGFVALGGNTTGNYNTAVGVYALNGNQTGGGNVGLGASALQNNVTGGDNTAVGDAALYLNSAGTDNTGIGWNALYGNTVGIDNAAFGYQSLSGNTTGGSNVAIGFQSLSGNTTGGANVAIGAQALKPNNGSNNIAIGYRTFLNATTSSSNTAIGFEAMEGGTTGSPAISGADNIGLGFEALNKYTAGSNNTALGYEAMLDATTSQNNTVVGYLAGEGASTNDNYQGLSAFGYQSGKNLSNSSNYNTLIGYQAGQNITTGANNVFLGADTSSYNTLTTGSGNISIGHDITLASTTGSNQLDIGNILFGSGITGTGSTVAGNIGIGTTTPYARLSVWGTDTASSTLAFNVVNSASTTEFAVFDGGNAQLSGTLSQNSDQRLKTNVQSLDASSSLSLINSLNPVTFNWIDPERGTDLQLGFIAQQVLPIFPNLVSTTSATALTPDGTLSLNYIGLISPIVSAIQALSSELASLENTIAGFATIFHTQELCVGSTCVTPTQFEAMVAAANVSQSSGQGSGAASSDNSDATDTPPIIQVNGDDPAIVQIGASYNDLGATITGPTADLNLGIQTFVNGVAMSPVQIDTSAAATDTIDYVATDQNGLTSTTTRTVIIEAPSIVPTDEPSTTAEQGTGSTDQTATSTAATSISS